MRSHNCCPCICEFIGGMIGLFIVAIIFLFVVGLLGSILLPYAYSFFTYILELGGVILFLVLPLLAGIFIAGIDSLITVLATKR